MYTIWLPFDDTHQKNKVKNHGFRIYCIEKFCPNVAMKILKFHFISEMKN